VAPRTRVSSGSPFEPTIGFSRAIRIGDRVLVSGTAPVLPDGSCPPDPADQARRCFAIIETALLEAGAALDDVVRTRMLLTDPADADAVGAVHGELLGEVRPAATMVAVSALLDPRWKVEIEAEAVVTPTLTLALVVDLTENAVAPFAAYEQQVLPLLARHGGRLDRRLRTADGRTEVHLLSFTDRAGYDAYLADPARAAAGRLLDGLDAEDLRRRLLDVTDADPGRW
jgi:enamine deaminase RidA (YjgF/YER057c/UK114 family)